MRALEKMRMPPSRSLEQGEVEDWLDVEIASLRHSVEEEAQPQQSRETSTDARSAPRQRRRLRARTRAGDRLVCGAAQLPIVVAGVLRAARRLLRTRRGAIVFYGCGIAIAVVAGWVISSMGQP
jgi:hypothetical protein